MENDMVKLNKQFAALAYALGVARGALSDVIEGDFTTEQIQRVYNATSVARIMSSIGYSENALDIFWDDYLTDIEKHKLQGYGSDQPQK